MQRNAALVCQHVTNMLLLASWVAALFTLFANAEPQSPVWPSQFHAVMFQNRTGNLALVDLWYDWPNGRNINIIHKQLGPTIFDLELNNGSQYVWFSDRDDCKTIQQPVGILPPDWLRNATYLGVSQRGPFEVDGWTKAPWPTKDRMFVHYYADVQTGQPVYWEFFTGAQFHVLSFEVNQTLGSDKLPMPEQCYSSPSPTEAVARQADSAFHWSSLLHTAA